MKFCNSVIDENSKYFKIYKSLIDKCRNRSSIKFYTERHRVIPKSLGGSNDETNLVNLTYREHYIAHLLLTKFILDEDSKYKMLKALKYFIFQGSKRTKEGINFNSKKYEKIKKIINKDYSNNMSIFMKKYHRENPEKFYRNIESRKLVSEKLAGENNGMYNTDLGRMDKSSF